MNIIIIDAQADSIAAALRQSNADITITGAYADSDQGIAAIGAQAPDLAIVNIDLAGMQALHHASPTGKRRVDYVFISEWATFAYEAFRFGATDYLLQPFNSGELQQSVDRVKGGKGVA